MKKKLLSALIVSTVFFIFGIVTNKNYGVSWDEPEHFFRGQAYLHLFLTGEETYENLKDYNLSEARTNKNYHERSYYQNDSYTADVWFTTDKGHPPLNGILASFFNLIFYQKLGIVGDIESYHLFNILTSSLLVGVVFLFGTELLGVVGGLAAAVFLGTYPLFWAESHFNIKDPAQTTFLFIAIYALWKAIDKRKRVFIFWSSLSAGIAFGIKLNILFLPFIIFPWVICLLADTNTRKFLLSKKTIALTLLYLPTMLVILIIGWPFLWQDIVGNTISVLSYYKGIGTEEGFNLNPIANWNLFAIRWILYTTPPLTLLFFMIGLFAIPKIWKNKNYAFVLGLSLFWVTIIRVSFPNTTIYGGVRQIMEFIPGLVLISAAGLLFLWNLIGKFQIKGIVIVIFMIFTINTTILYRLHPNENVYFNFLVGGLHGAVVKEIPWAESSYGNAYWQTTQWLNNNAEYGSRIALIQGTSLNIPVNQLRYDLDFSNNNWSGIYRNGEYLVELYYKDNLKLYPYAWNYVDNFLDPVYEVKVDDVPIAKVWKNDLSHTKQAMKKNEALLEENMIKKRVEEDTLYIDLEKETLLSRIELFYKSPNCNKIEGVITTSTDGNTWESQEETLSTEQVTYLDKPKPEQVFFFPGTQAKFLKIDFRNTRSCLDNNYPKAKLRILD